MLSIKVTTMGKRKRFFIFCFFLGFCVFYFSLVFTRAKPRLRLGICDKGNEIDDGNTIVIVRKGEIANNGEERFNVFCWYLVHSKREIFICIFLILFFFLFFLFFLAFVVEMSTLYKMQEIYYRDIVGKMEAITDQCSLFLFVFF